MSIHCEDCGKAIAITYNTVYGDTLCEDCWDEYICTDRGSIEYFMNIAKDEIPAGEFDADFLCRVMKNWELQKATLATLGFDIEALENKFVENLKEAFNED